MPNSINSTYFVPIMLAFGAHLPPDTCLELATVLAEACEEPVPLGPFTDEAAKAITAVSQCLTRSKAAAGGCDAALAPAAATQPESWFKAVSGAVTSKRIIGWSAVIGGGYMLVTTFLEWRRVAGEAGGKEGEGSGERKRDGEEEMEAAVLRGVSMSGGALLWVLGWIVLGDD